MDFEEDDGYDGGGVLMPPALPRPARRVNLYLYSADCEQLERRYGRGWTEQVRLMVEKNCHEYTRGKTEIDRIMEDQDGQ